MTITQSQGVAARTIPVWGAILFLLTATLQKRHIFPSSTQFLTGTFTEAGIFALYASDIVFGVLMLGWLVSCPWRRPYPRTFVLLCACFGTWVLVESFRSVSVPLGLYHAGRAIQGIILSLIVVDILRQRSAWQKIAAVIILVGLAQSMLGISQVFAQRSLGFSIIGEPVLSITLPGVAKVDTTHGKVLRAYGTFPHANVLGGFLVMILMLLLLMTIWQGTEDSSLAWTISGTLIMFGALVTFSRSAHVSLLILFVIYCIQYFKHHNKFPWKSIVIIFLVPTIIFYLFFSRAIFARIFLGSSDQSISERVRTGSIALSVWKKNFILGTGSGNYFPKIISLVPSGTRGESWKYQYPHNIILTVAVEYGIIGVLLFLSLFLFPFFQKKIQKIRFLFYGIYSVFLPLLLFDHYLWTTQQGRILLWVTIGVMTSLIPAMVERRPVDQKISH